MILVPVMESRVQAQLLPVVWLPRDKRLRDPRSDK